MDATVRHALLLVFVLNPWAFSAEIAQCSAAPEPPRYMAFNNSDPQILVGLPFEKLNGVDCYTPEGPKCECERDGVVMSGFAAFEKGKWLDSYPYKPAEQPYKNMTFVRMTDPSKEYHPSGEAVIEDYGTVEGRAVVFRDMECERKRTGPWHGYDDVLISKPAWCSPARPASSPPAVEELAGRMKRDMAQEEEKERQRCEKLQIACSWCDQGPYNPAKLRPPRLIDALEFEIAPGESVFFVMLRRDYPCKDVRESEGGCNSSNWCSIVRKNGLESLWTQHWMYMHDKMEDSYWPIGAADVNGDGVSEVMITNSHYGGGYCAMGQYKRGDKKLSFEFSAGTQD